MKFLSSLIFSIANIFSVYYLFSSTNIAHSYIILMTVILSLTIFFKEYTKMKTSHIDGKLIQKDDKLKNRRIKQILSIAIATGCAVSIESLFLYSAYISLQNASFTNTMQLSFFAGVLIFSVANIPIDMAFYWNCIRKYFNLNSYNSSHPFSSILNTCLQLSAFSSSCYFLFRSILFIYMTTKLFSLSFLLGGLIGIICLCTNLFIMLESINELQMSPSTIVEFKINLKSKQISHLFSIFSILYSLLFALPCFQSLYKAALHIFENQHLCMVLALASSLIMMHTYFKLTKDYLNRYCSRGRVVNS